MICLEISTFVRDREKDRLSFNYGNRFANTKKARLVLGVTEQVAEDQWERHMKTVDVDVPVSADLNPKCADIIGGHWLENE